MASSLPHLVDGHDSLRFGLPSLKQDAVDAHPVETLQKTSRQTERQTREKLMELTYGSAFTTRMKIDENILSGFQRFPSLPSSMLGLESYTGKLEDFSFEDYLGGPHDESETSTRVDPHHAMEVRLKLTNGPAARAYH